MLIALVVLRAMDIRPMPVRVESQCAAGNSKRPNATMYMPNVQVRYKDGDVEVEPEEDELVVGRWIRKECKCSGPDGFRCEDRGACWLPQARAGVSQNCE